MKIKKGDTIQVMCGEYNGKRGRILRMFRKRNLCIVEGVNFQTKHQRPTSPGQQAGRLQKEGPIHISNVRLICPRCGLPTRVGKKKIGDKFVRVCKKCSEMIED